MLRDGIGVRKNGSLASEYFAVAFAGFRTLEEKSHDDKLQYWLGKENLLGRNVKQDIGKATAYFKLAAKQGSEHAAYQLGKLYLSEELGLKDVGQGIHWMETAAEKGNQYAQYILGKLYLYGGDILPDKEKAVYYLSASAEQGNIYARFLLEHMDSSHEPSAVFAATRLLRHLENLFREDYRKNADTDKFHRMDRKRRRRMAEKKHAQGHKEDAQESAQTIY